MTSTRNPNWYLRVKTMSEEYLVDVGSDPERARVALENARRLMRETGAVTIGDALVVNASDIESIALQDAAASAQPLPREHRSTEPVGAHQGWLDQTKDDPGR